MKRTYERYSFLVLSLVFLIVLTQMPFGREFHPMIVLAAGVVAAFGVFILVLRALKKRKDKFDDV